MLNRIWHDCLFSFYRVEEQHVQFRVNQNPQNVDADNMVDNIGKYVKNTLAGERHQMLTGDTKMWTNLAISEKQTS